MTKTDSSTPVFTYRWALGDPPGAVDESAPQGNAYDWRRKGPCRRISAASRRAIREALADVAGEVMDAGIAGHGAPTEISHG